MSSYVTGLVIQTENREQYVCTDFVVGHIMQVPCPDGQLSQIDGDYWAVPVVDDGLFSGFKFSPGGAAETVGPTAQSFQVTRVTDNTSSNTVYVRGNTTQFEASCSVCCGNTPVPMPTNIPRIAPCQNIFGVAQGSTGVGCVGIFALPNLYTGFGYLPTVYYNNALLTVNPTQTGYTSVSSLLTYLNSVAGSVGVWAVSSDNLTITVTPSAGSGPAVVCFSAIGINASGSPF